MQKEAQDISPEQEAQAMNEGNYTMVREMDRQRSIRDKEIYQRLLASASDVVKDSSLEVLCRGSSLKATFVSEGVTIHLSRGN